jgi:hypothetical protein
MKFDKALITVTLGSSPGRDTDSNHGVNLVFLFKC